MNNNPVEFLEPKHFTKHCVEIEKPPEEQFYNDAELALNQKELASRYEKKTLLYAIICYRALRVDWYESWRGCPFGME